MQAVMKILIFIALHAASAIALDQGCSTPDRFESAVVEYDYVNQLYRKGRLFYDAWHERERFFEETFLNKTATLKEVLILWKSYKMYVLDVKTRACTVTQPKIPFHRFQVGDDFTWAGAYDIGVAPTEGVEIGVWYKTFNTTDLKGLSLAQFTVPHCLPVYFTFDGTYKKKKVHFHRYFFNVVTQTIDPNVFDVPKECLK